VASQKSQIIASAQAFAAKGKFDKAIAEWRKLVSETPQDGNVYNTIADLYLRINDKENAIDTCLKAAAVFKETGFELKGVAVLKKILKIDSNRIDICERLADINAERGLTGSAIDAYQQTAKLYVQRSNFKAAIAVYRKLLLISPEDSDIHMAIARLFQKQEQYREAILAYEQAAVIYEGKKMVSEARQVTEEIFKIDPSYLKHIAKKEASVAELDNIVTPKDMMLFPPSSTQDIPRVNARFAAMAPGIPVVEEYSMPRSHGQETELYPEILPFSPSVAEEQEPPIYFPEGHSQEGTVDGVTMAESSPVAGSSFLEEFKETAHHSPLDKTPLFEETGFSSPPPRQVVKTRLEGKKSVDVSEIIFQAHLAEVDVYLRYGLNQNAIDRLLLAKELVPTREEPYIRLREIYLKEGQNAKAAEMGMALARLHEQKDGLQEKEVALTESQWKGQQAPDVVPQRQVPVRQQEVGPAPYDWSPVEANEAPQIPDRVKEGAPWGLRKETHVQQNIPLSGAGIESSGEEGYFDLTSAVVRDFSALTDGPLVAPQKGKDLTQEYPAKAGYDEKRQQYVETCHHLGIVHKEMGNYEKAVREFEQALLGAGAGKFREILILLAACYVEAGYIAKAIEILQNGMQDSRCEGRLDDHVFIQYELASYFEQLGDREKSYALYKEIYRVRPQFKDVSGKVKEIPYRKHGDTRKERYGVLADLPIEEETSPREGVTHPALIKEKRRISYV
jgi:tetratricopeptide (TPR) repeat protein